MAIALTISRPGQETEIIPLGSFRLHRDFWAPTAAGLGLELIPMFYDFFPVLPKNLDQLLAESAVFRAELVRLGTGYEVDIDRLDRLVATLHQLKESEGWDAAIG